MGVTDGAARMCRLRQERLRKKFAIEEEPLQFGGGGFLAVAGVADVDHLIDPEVAADGAFFGDARVGGAEQFAHAADDVFAFDGDGHDGAALHEGDDFREERPVCDVGVVFFEDVFVKSHHFDATQAKTGGFEAAEHAADEVFGDAIRFAENKGSFLGHSGCG